MSSGMDDAYKMECEARGIKAIQRRYAQGPTKRAVIEALNHARGHLQGAKDVLDELEERVKKETRGQRAFFDETESLGFYIQKLERMASDVQHLGLDLQEVCKTHKHHYTSEDPDEGCTSCGLTRGPA